MSLVLPDDFRIPEGPITDRCCLRVLTVDDTEKDYDAVISSIDHLRKTKPFGPRYEYDWPSTDLTLEQNTRDLQWHQKEFEQLSSFAFTVMNVDESQCLGCVYIYPSKNSQYDAQIIMWVRQSELDSGLDAHLFSIVKQWVEEKWPLKNPGYPGRDIDWEAWYALK
jgi:hypothetical protein